MPLASGEITLTAPLIRHTADGDPVELDVTLTVRADLTARYQPAVMYLRNGDPGYPEEPAEWEFTLLSAEEDGAPGDDAAGPITDAEMAVLRAWLDAKYERAAQEACEAKIGDRRRED